MWAALPARGHFDLLDTFGCERCKVYFDSKKYDCQHNNEIINKKPLSVFGVFPHNEFD